MEVYEPQAEITNNISSVEKVARFEIFLAITSLSMAITVWRKRS